MVLTSAEKSARYRAKDVEAYRARKNALAKLPHHRVVRAEYARQWRAQHRKPRKARVRRFTDEEISQHKQAAAKAYRIAHREELRHKSAKYYRQNGHKREYKAKVRDYRLRKKYGLTAAQFDEMFLAQGARCKICAHSVPKNKRGWQLDHCHETGRVRGILCHVCNTKLGWYQQFKTSIEAYLK
jgi:Recombination endonuclease VII